MNRYILCQHCGGRINSADNLVTAFVIFSVVPYHRRCYSHALQGCQAVVVSNRPVNSVMGTAGAALGLALAIAIFLGISPFQGGMRLALGAAVMAAPIARIYSYLAYERHLDPD